MQSQITVSTPYGVCVASDQGPTTGLTSNWLLPGSTRNHVVTPNRFYELVKNGPTEHTRSTI